MKKMICLGDSLTEGAGLELNRTWSALIDNGLPGVEVVNQGIGGDTTGGMLARFSSMVVPAKPDLVLLLGGSNDLWFGLEQRTIIANLYALVSQAKYHGMVPMMATPLPFVLEMLETQPWLPPPEGYGVMSQGLASLGQALKVQAESSEILFVDLYAAFCDETGAVQPQYFMEDGIHPNYQGHQRMARVVLDVLRKELLCA